ncbi:hypothetical protein DFP72DRAFT_1057949 [Ephemerocybe angulata]|uniref:F-box domain-containing protein n=1 Tax=Ephemerocybe angulata TaxID=980116 RepID=A0A8H6IGS1_9AGAR|nr:hypothetical protein DFP72DRAFT_1057949 [Tulosesus angulatus]
MVMNTASSEPGIVVDGHTSQGAEQSSTLPGRAEGRIQSLHNDILVEIFEQVVNTMEGVTSRLDEGVFFSDPSPLSTHIPPSSISGTASIYNLALVCRTWYAILASQPSFWTTIVARTTPRTPTADASMDFPNITARLLRSRRLAIFVYLLRQEGPADATTSIEDERSTVRALLRSLGSDMDRVASLVVQTVHASSLPDGPGILSLCGHGSMKRIVLNAAVGSPDNGEAAINRFRIPTAMRSLNSHLSYFSVDGMSILALLDCGAEESVDVVYMALHRLSVLAITNLSLAGASRMESKLFTFLHALTYLVSLSFDNFKILHQTSDDTPPTALIGLYVHVLKIRNTHRGSLAYLLQRVPTARKVDLIRCSFEGSASVPSTIRQCEALTLDDTLPPGLARIPRTIPPSPGIILSPPTLRLIINGKVLLSILNLLATPHEYNLLLSVHYVTHFSIKNLRYYTPGFSEAKLEGLFELIGFMTRLQELTLDSFRVRSPFTYPPFRRSLLGIHVGRLILLNTDSASLKFILECVLDAKVLIVDGKIVETPSAFSAV